MSDVYEYFTIPFDSVPTDQPPPYTVWYATWSKTPPILEPGMAPPIVIGATDSGLPAGATALGSCSKDPPPPPLAIATSYLSDYETAVSQWLELTRDADE
jgi:hypothetical protein